MTRKPSIYAMPIKDEVDVSLIEFVGTGETIRVWRFAKDYQARYQANRRGYKGLIRVTHGYAGRGGHGEIVRTAKTFEVSNPI